MATRLVILAVLLSLYPLGAQATPMYSAQMGHIRVVLDSGKCEMKEVSNLPMKATWTENGKVFQGCWGYNPQIGVIVAYFDDKTAVAIPANVFEKVTGV